ncbi:MAG: ParB/RepB/Spo0J family partition protein [Clostridia bacterium]|nr:ParB/RepB/Spo0J family partition protein [Clostridia bacterium]
MKTTLSEISISNLKDFENNPFIFREDTAFEMLMESISNLGVITPIIVRTLDDGNFEIISGHRRVEACRRLKIETIPCIVKELIRDEATVILVDLNLQRDEVLPSEKAYAYKMKMDALKNQGARTDLTSRQPVDKSDSRRTGEIIGEEAGDSERQVQRYIRLTYLLPEILKLVDEERIAFTPAVELSYIPLDLQERIYDFYTENEVTPSYSQAVRMKNYQCHGNLTIDKINEILSEEKPNQKEYLKIPTDRLYNLIKPWYTEKQKQEFIIKAVEHYNRYLQRQQYRGSR